MCAVSNSLCGEWKLKRALQDMETPAQSLAFYSVDTQSFLLIKVRDSENTSLLVYNSNISLLFPPDTFMVITFAVALWQALASCMHLNTELVSCADGTLTAAGWTLKTVKPLLTVTVARSRVVCTSAAIFF